MDDFDTNAAAASGTINGFNSGNGEVAGSKVTEIDRVVVSPGATEPTTPANISNSRPKSDTFCCAVDRLSHGPLDTDERCFTGVPLRIRIKDAQKTTDSSGTFIVYCLEFKSCSVKRRYSDFESLRNALAVLNPTCIIPPIPEKHTIVSYATNKKPKDDVVMIEKRKRMLQSFLNRVAEHPVLSFQHIFHRFLEEDRAWSDILAAEHIKKEKAPVLSNGKLKHPDAKFAEIENDNSYYGHSLSSVEKTHKRIVRRWQEVAADLSDLGSCFNSFSLEEEGPTAPLLEKIGEAVDSMHRSGNSLATYHEEQFAECLQEYAQFSKSLKDLLKYRKHKQLELEDVSEQISNKQNQLVQMESNPTANMRRSGSMLNTITSTLNNVLDISPDASRRNGISKARDQINQFELLKQKKEQELAEVSKKIEEELAWFQDIRKRDLKYILGEFIKAQIKYYVDCRDSWKQTLDVIQ